MNELVALAPKVKDSSQLKDVQAKWDETKTQAAKRAGALGSEAHTQQNNEALRKKFAAAAADVKAWLDAQSAKLANTSGDLAAQQTALEKLTSDNAQGDAKIDNVSGISTELDTVRAVNVCARRCVTLCRASIGRRDRQSAHGDLAVAAQGRVRAAAGRHQDEAQARRARARQEEQVCRV
jgi:hypothetical protein